MSQVGIWLYAMPNKFIQKTFKNPYKAYGLHPKRLIISAHLMGTRVLLHGYTSAMPKACLYEFWPPTHAPIQFEPLVTVHNQRQRPPHY